jgi:high-affinity nickel permease
MKKYAETIFSVSLVIAGIVGFINWVTMLADCLSYGNTLGFVLGLIFCELLVPFYSILPFIIVFVILFLGILPIYGIYKLFKK